MKENPYAKYVQPTQATGENPYAKYAMPIEQPDIPVQAENIPEAPFDPFNQRKRGADIANMVAATSAAPVDRNQQTIGETVPQIAMSEVGALGDVAGAGLGALAKGAYNIMPESGQKRISSDIERFSKTIAPAAEQYQQNQEAYNLANPRAGRNLQAVREFGNVLPLGFSPARRVAGEALDIGGSSLKSAATAKGVPDILKSAPPPLSSAQRKIYSGALYDEADALGGVLKPEARQQFRNEIAKYADIGGERLTSGKSVFEDMLETTEKFKDKPLTLKGFETIDKKLTNLIHKERSVAGISNEGRELMELQDNLRDMVDNPNPDMVIGGTEGFGALRNATKEYKITKQQEELENIIEYANKTDNPATSLKAQMRVLSRNKKRMAGYDNETRALINKAATDNKFADFLRTTAGSRLIGGMVGGMVGAGSGAAVGGGIGALPGAIGGALTGAAARSGAKAIKTGQIKKIEKSIAKKSSAEQIPREIYNLPPAEAKEAIRKLREAK